MLVFYKIIFPMNFTSFFIIFVFFIEGIWKILCSADFDALELKHLSEKLHPMECMKLLDAMYLRTPSYVVRDEKENSERQNTGEHCRVKLEEWNRTFPGKNNERGRATMLAVLRSLGRPDLVNYVKRSGRIVRMLNNMVNPSRVSQGEEKFLERREASKIPAASSREKEQGKHKKSFFSSNSGHASVKAHSMTLGASHGGPYHEELKKQLIASAHKQIEPKEVALQGFGSSKSETSQSRTRIPDNADHSAGGTSPNRWIAFGIFLLIIFTIILITALIAIYKSGRFFPDLDKLKKTCDDRCPLKEHFQPTDIEHGWTTSTTDYTGARWRRSSSIPSSRSPSMICKRDKKKRARRVKRYRDKQQQTNRLEKKRKSKEAKIKKKKKVPTKDAEKKELSFRDKIVSILRKDKPDCKCCRCSFGEENAGNHRICSDDHCKERRILNLTDLCYSPRKKSPKKSKKTSSSKPRNEEKEHKKPSPEISPRQKRESQFKETFTKIKEKSPRWSLDHHEHIEPCTRLTCDMRRSPRDRNSVDFDENCHK